jgi:hypothetical protein
LTSLRQVTPCPLWTVGFMFPPGRRRPAPPRAPGGRSAGWPAAR